MCAEHLSPIYAGLAQALAPPSYDPPPAWFCAPGRDWPIFEPAVQIAARQANPHWRQAIEALAAVKTSSRAARRAEYKALFIGQGRPPIWLYEARHVNGRIPGPATFTVQNIYKQAGLESEGAELPDHAALELSFLAFLSRQEIESADTERLAVRRLFIKNHAGLWLPDVGRALMHSAYPAWQALGQLLVASLSPNTRPPRSSEASEVAHPVILEPSDCTLCGFCVQSCPTRALSIHEDDSATALWLAAKRCISCEQCARVCLSKALAMEGASNTSTPVLLRQSERAICPACKTHTVSQAELEAIVTQLGEHPRWLDYCLDCRILSNYQMELNQ